MLSKIT